MDWATVGRWHAPLLGPAVTHAVDVHPLTWANIACMIDSLSGKSGVALTDCQSDLGW